MRKVVTWFLAWTILASTVAPNVDAQGDPFSQCFEKTWAGGRYQLVENDCRPGCDGSWAVVFIHGDGFSHHGLYGSLEEASEEVRKFLKWNVTMPASWGPYRTVGPFRICGEDDDEPSGENSELFDYAAPLISRIRRAAEKAIVEAILLSKFVPPVVADHVSGLPFRLMRAALGMRRDVEVLRDLLERYQVEATAVIEAGILEIIDSLNGRVSDYENRVVELEFSDNDVASLLIDREALARLDVIAEEVGDSAERKIAPVEPGSGGYLASRLLGATSRGRPELPMSGDVERILGAGTGALYGAIQSTSSSAAPQGKQPVNRDGTILRYPDGSVAARQSNLRFCNLPVDAPVDRLMGELECLTYLYKERLSYAGSLWSPLPDQRH